MMIFQNFPGFYMKIIISREIAKYFARFAQLSAFLVPRGPDAPGPLKPMQFHPFLGFFGAPGSIFRKM